MERFNTSQTPVPDKTEEELFVLDEEPPRPADLSTAHSIGGSVVYSLYGAPPYGVKPPESKGPTLDTSFPDAA